MSYPFSTFPLVNRVGVTNPYAAVDARYGPWNSRIDALTAFNVGLRSQGLTLGIIEGGKVVEYWYRDNVSDENLIIKDFSEYLPLSGGDISGNLNVQTKLLSAGTDLLDIFLTTETDSQTLFYDITSEDLTIVRGNTVNLSALSYRNIENQASTIEEFANSYSGSIFQGYTVTLYNERVYAFAGTDKNNPNHYLEVNSNPYKPIYREVSLSGNEIVLDTFYLGDFKSAKYNLQIETNFNNEIYYSEINVIGSVETSIGTACEYGVIFTDQLIMGYDASVSINNLNLILYYNYDPTPDRKLIIKGHRTNFYKI
jgi:hypothetical protein